MTMRVCTTLSAMVLGLCLVSAAERTASGQSGVYAVVERVVFEPPTGLPDRIQIWGAFALMERIGDGFTNYVYRKPARGYMYFRLRPAHPQDVQNARREWKDLESVAGTRQAVAFGYWNNYEGDKHPTVRTAEVRPENPDDYRMDIGLTKLGTTGSSAAAVEALLKLVAAR